MKSPLDSRIEAELDQFRRDGVYKHLNYIESPQAPRVRMEGRGEVIVLSSNNYLGLSNEPEVVAAGQAALDHYGAVPPRFASYVGRSPYTGNWRPAAPGW
jgi:7-keto-8-aminopelargonate synthetase and related enzymes